MVFGEWIHPEKDTVIGAGPVITRDIPAFSIAAGIPARVAKKRK